MSKQETHSANIQNPLRSVHTSNLPEILSQLNISLAVSTYQAGKVILVRNDESKINTHFRNFAKPMGIAADYSRLTIGGTNTVWYYRNMPAVAAKLAPPGKHDACYLPRRIHVTGDIDIHEMAWSADNELWIVNTRFCCLCTLDQDHSFVPRWRPHFVYALAPQDRCHLNGLAMVNGEVTSFENEMYITECTWMRKHGWRTSEWKLIIALEPDFHFKPEVELYNLRLDPEENHNVAAENPEVVDLLRARLDTWIAQREQETGLLNPIHHQGDWHGHKGVGPFKTSQQAYDTLYIGSLEVGAKLQSQSREE